MSVPVAVRWSGDRSAVDLLDQTLLPEVERRLELRSAANVAVAIREMRVRGAPAIGIAAAMGVAAELARDDVDDTLSLRSRFDDAFGLLADARPTAVNLRWALERMRRRFEELDAEMVPRADVIDGLRDEAERIADEDRAMCRRIGERALELFAPEVSGVLTHCNAGALATGGIGTALAPVYLLHERGRSVRVFADETRPLLQGSRLTAWELRRAGVDVTLLADAAAASLMASGGVDLVIVGADRIAANGDVANKIGTYGLAVLARHHGIPFYVAAPWSTVDLATATGAGIPIEMRDPDELRRGFGRATAPADVPAHTPAFDVTPAALVSAIVTDRGVLRAPYEASLRRMAEQPIPGASAAAAGPANPQSRG